MTLNQLLQGMGTLYEPEPNTGCWLWTHGAFNDGYGSVWINGRDLRTNRAMWKAVHGSIPKGMLVLHKCDTPMCCNPDHLFLGTQKDNIVDMYRKGRGVDNRGEKHGMSKLTNSDVVQIKSMITEGRAHKEIAHHFGVTRSAIYLIATGQRWAWL